MQTRVQTSFTLKDALATGITALVATGAAAVACFYQDMDLSFAQSIMAGSFFATWLLTGFALASAVVISLKASVQDIRVTDFGVTAMSIIGAVIAPFVGIIALIIETLAKGS